MKKEPKKKVYVIMVSRTFPASHPRKGEQTGFVDLILSDGKIHTCRGNYAKWYAISLEVQAGLAIISLRYWDSIPYSKGSKKIEFCVLNWIHVQKVHVYQIFRSDEMDRFISGRTRTEIFIEDSLKPLQRPFLFAAHDGLSMADFNAWFKKQAEDMACIHFTSFTYPVIK